jgi:hypothetical protein
MTAKKPRRYLPNRLARLIVDLATGALSEAEAPPELRRKNPAAVELGRLGGLKGGKARAAALSKARRQEIARAAAKSRWKSKS